MAKDIAATGAEIVLLQEVDDQTSRTCGMADQADYIAQQLGWTGGWHSCYRSATSHQGGTMGNAVISKHSLSTCSKKTYTRVSGQGEDRNMTIASLTVRGQSLEVASTHLAVEDASVRRSQADEAEAFLVGASGAAAIGGDFNAEQKDPELHSLASRTDALPWLGIFTATHDDGRQIDHLFVKGLTPKSAKVYSSSDTSDHRPLRVTFA